MKAGQQSLHDKRRQTRVGKEAHAQELDDVRVAEGAHQLTFPHKLSYGLGKLVADFVSPLQNVVDGFRGRRHRYGHLLHDAVGPATNSNASTLHVGEQERPQLRVVAKKISSHRGQYCRESRSSTELRTEAERGHSIVPFFRYIRASILLSAILQCNAYVLICARAVEKLSVCIPTSSSSADSGTSTSIVESRNKGLCKCMVLYLYHTIRSRNTVRSIHD